MTFEGKYDRYATAGIILCLIILAAVIRANGLGRWPVNSDEYLLLQSTSFIQDMGFPMFPSGGYYVRGIALQYLMAFTTWIIPNKEFGLRLVPLFFGILTIPVFFMFCKKMVPTIPAVLCSMVLVFSSWHIEFSRFARFYTTFQFMFFLFLYYFYAGYWENEKKYVWWSWGIALISVFVFEASIFIPIIIVLLILFREDGWNKKVTITSFYAFLLLIANYLVNGVNYRNLGVKNALPLELVEGQSGNSLKHLPINLPPMDLVFQVWNSYLTIIAYSLIICIGLSVFHILNKKVTSKNIWSHIFILSTVFLPLFHLYALLVFLFAIIFINRKDIYGIFLNNITVVSSYVILSLLFWISVIVSTGNENKMLHYIVGYPMIRSYILDPYIESVPKWGVLASGIIGISVLHNAFSRNIIKNGFVLSVILLCIFILSLFNLPEQTTRYSFFFFPLIFVLAFQEMDSLIHWMRQKFTFQQYTYVTTPLLVLPLLCFSVTEDFHVEHVIDAPAMELNFRMGKYEQYQDHWYERFDYRTPAEYVNDHLKEGDSVIVDSNPFGAYLKTDFIFYSPKKVHWFAQFSRNFGTEEIWSGAKMVSEISSIVKEIPIDTKNSLWLISKQQIAGGDHVRDIAESYNLHLALKYEGLDGRFKVWQLKSQEPGSRTMPDKKKR